MIKSAMFFNGRIIRTIPFLLVFFLFFSCKTESVESLQLKKLYKLLETGKLTEESHFSVMNQISELLLNSNNQDNLILFLTENVNNNPDDKYNAYWLLMTAYAYQKKGADPVAELIFQRILKNYDDLIVKGKSIHLRCLQILIQISKSPEDKIYYFTQLISRFSSQVNKTELYFRLAMEYEKLAEWNQVLKAYSDFLQQPDAAEIQIAGVPDAYSKARNLVEFNKSSKSWTFESLDALVAAVNRSISWGDYNTLEKYRSEVNFFSMSWRQDETQKNSIANFKMRDFMLGNRIRYNQELDPSSTPNEAFLRTWGWSSYVNVWYLYFRKVNFPLDPNIHGQWEWAGIYYGEKL